MSQQTEGIWRSLDRTEVALIKRMKMNGLPRDFIMSFFVRPGRKISAAAPNEIIKKFPDISPASNEEVAQFIERRIRETSNSDRNHGFNPVSSLRVHEILDLTSDGQSALPGFESHFAEFKREIPAEKAGKAKIARSMASFANNNGGYLFFGICDDGHIIGIDDSQNVERFWNDISDVVTRNFSPFFPWERSVVEISGKMIAVIYVFASDAKPIYSSSDFTKHIEEGSIYFRYNRSSEKIKAGDLFNILQKRDQRVAASALAEGAAVTQTSA
ncbi:MULTISPECIES: helix-turn-helix domain-containing protein [unclassified Caulobacter]|uniref:AlbA family DNA-binding domain-containing protein n=1 Tax=unclassified Caulobacter TaxID=2648921 RepID=UPI000A71BDAE|nr:MULTISPECIES: ATP-binding protein [unclassified Caulobacter]